MSLLIVITFVGGFALFFAIIFGLYEFICTAKYKASIFEIGKSVFTREEEIGAFDNRIKVNETIETYNGNFKFIDNYKCVFRRRFSGDFSFQKGSILLKDGKIYVDIRLPLGRTVFIMNFIVLASCIELANIYLYGFDWFYIVAIIIAWLFFGLPFIYSLNKEKKIMIKIYEDIKEYLS